jgi:hypothetical protein
MTGGLFQRRFLLPAQCLHAPRWEIQLRELRWKLNLAVCVRTLYRSSSGLGGFTINLGANVLALI